MNKSESIAKLSASLTKFQSEMQSVKKGSVNPFYKSTYADLASIIEAIREPLATNGLAFSQFPSGQNGLRTILMHESGEWIEETFYVSPTDSKPQSLGSAITYARRYALGAILGIATEDDDDGNEASKEVKKGPVKKDVPVDKKSQIMSEMKRIGAQPAQSTKEAWERAVKASTDLELVPENFDKILEKLKNS